MRFDFAQCKQKGQIPVLILVGMLIIALVVGGAYYLEGQTFPKSTPTPAVSPTPQPTSLPDPIANWKIYNGVNTGWGPFQLQYPTNWRITKAGCGLSLNSNTEELILCIYGPGSSSTAAELSNFLVGDKETLEKNEFILNNHKAIKKITKDRVYVFVDDGKTKDKDLTTVYISYKNSSINQSILDQILSTFRFLDDLPKETGPQTSCVSNKDCWCKEFTGAEFIPGKKVEGVCDTKINRCQECLYY